MSDNIRNSTEERGSEPMTRCEWCRNPNAEDLADPFKLCDMHAAEYEGVTLDYFERREAGQYAEYLDTLG